MATNESFDIQGPAGRLEAILMHPEGAPRAAAVVCHAHPLHGGVMHFKVIFRAAKALQAHGVATLRFNFRGVGRSEGEHDHGKGEQGDTRAALDEVAARFPGLPVVLGGFSFGSAMALRVAPTDPRVKAAFALGFPVAMGYDTTHLPEITVPRLFVQGEKDEFGDAARITAVVDALPEPRQLVIVPGADHFFADQLDELQRAIESWARAAPWDA